MAITFTLYAYFTSGGGGDGRGDTTNQEGCQIFVKTPFYSRWCGDKPGCVCGTLSFIHSAIKTFIGSDTEVQRQQTSNVNDRDLR